MSTDTAPDTSDTADPTRRQQHVLDRYSTFRAGEALGNAVPGYSNLGGRAGSIADRIAARHKNLDFTGVNPDFSSWESLGPGSNEQGLAGLTRTAAKKFKGQKGDFDQRMAAFRAKLGSGVAGSMQQGAQAEFMPSIDAAQKKADQLAGTSAISGEQEQAIRSNLVAQIRMAANTRMARTAAALGYGNNVNSPAAAALAQEEAEQTDSTIVSTLRDLGLQVNELNRTQARADVDLASRVSAMRQAILSGNPSTLVSLQKDVTAMMDALYSRDQAMDLAEKQLKEAGKQSTAERLSQWTDVASGYLDMTSKMIPGMSLVSGSNTQAPSPTPQSSSPAYQYNMPDYGQQRYY